jgi:hypothetical protein
LLFWQVVDERTTKEYYVVALNNTTNGT